MRTPPTTTAFVVALVPVPNCDAPDPEMRLKLAMEDLLGKHGLRCVSKLHVDVAAKRRAPVNGSLYGPGGGGLKKAIGRIASDLTPDISP